MRDSPDQLGSDLRRQLYAIRMRAERLSPLDIHRRMDAIRLAADRAGLDALSNLAGLSAQLALLPGCRVATGACLDHAADAIAARSASERQAVLAAVAARLH